MDKNNQRSRKDFITCIRKYDDRAISYNKAKSKLWDMTKTYLHKHF